MVAATARATTNQAMAEEKKLSRPPGRFVPIAIAVAIVPGPAVNGMVSGKNAIFRIVLKLAVDVGRTSGAGGGAWSIAQPETATTSPPAIRKAGIDIPKKFRIWLPTK